MDMFKLLARSTGLQKTLVTRQDNTQPTPSAGLREQAFQNRASKEGLDESSSETRRGKKRKRQDQDRSLLSRTQELNSLRSVSRELEEREIIQTPREPNDTDVGQDKVKESTNSLDEEACKKIYKEHKLKVTVLSGNKKRLGKTKRLSDESVHKKRKNEHIQIWPQPLQSFAELRQRYGIAKRLSENLISQGYREPTEVQIGALPLLLGTDADRGLRSRKRREEPLARVDLFTIAPTGSGKTLTFLLPIFQQVVAQRHANKEGAAGRQSKSYPQAIVLAPTHELVDQIVNEARKIAQGTGIRVTAAKKGMTLQPTVRASSSDHEENFDPQDTEALEKKENPVVKADVLVSTPMMMRHLSSSTREGSDQSLASIQYLVLDEADVLLDPLFRDQTLDVWRSCVHPHLQTSLWSATIGSSIETLAQGFILDRRRDLNLKDSKTHYILRLVVGLKDSSIPLINHRLTYTATEQGKLLALRQILHPTAPASGSSTNSASPTLQPPFLIFTQTIPRAIALHSELLYDIPIEAGGSGRIAVLHADLSVTARAEIMSGLRRGEIWIVITTDLLSRGVDIRGMNGVVNYDIPTTGAAYVHRAGRTGRQGRKGGVAITLYTKEDIPYVKNVANVIVASERAAASTAKAGDNTEQQSKRKAASVEDTSNGGIQPWLLTSLPSVSKKTRKDLKRHGVESRRRHYSINPKGNDDGTGKDSTAQADKEGLSHGTALSTSTTKSARSDKDNRKIQSRISTKSGYDRRLQAKRKGAIKANQARRDDFDDDSDGSAKHGGGGNEEEWSGFVE